MEDGGGAGAEELLDVVEVGGRDLLEDAEPEGLGKRRGGGVEQGVSPRHLDPAGAALGGEAGAGLDEARTAQGLGPFETTGQGQIDKREWDSVCGGHRL